MFRLLGFLLGSATSIAIILLVTGIPEFHLANPELDEKRFDEAVERLMARKLDIEPMAQKDIAATEPPIIETADSAEANVTSKGDQQIANATESTASTATVIETLENERAESTENVPDLPTVASQKADAQWYSFWNPFRSELAANGFVSQLEKVTGLDYRVVRVKTGVYEVAFAYLDDNERRSKLSQISVATGLELPDS